MKHLILAVALLCAAAAGPLLAGDSIGTAGRLRGTAIETCGAPIQDQFQGACDPAPVSDKLPAAQQASAHVERANKLIRLGRIEQAYQAANDALGADPRHADALVLRVRIDMMLMSGNQLERDMNAASLLIPDNPYLLATRAELSLFHGAPKSALRDATAALKQLQDDVDILRITADAHLRLDQMILARPLLDRALTIEPDEPRSLLSRAKVLLHLGDTDKALADADKVLAKRPTDVSVLELRMFIYTALGRVKEALSDLDAILGPPDNPHAGGVRIPHYSKLMVQRAILLAQLNRTVDAGRDIDTVISSGGKRAVLRLQLFLRKNGFEDLPLDGKRTHAFDEALQACIINQACGRGLVRSI
jgi:tetratricopeptide (TPR) repeat protein